MPNLMAFALFQPRTDAHLAASGEVEAPVLIPATATATPAPDANTSYVSTRSTDTVRAFIRYTGTVTSATLVLHVLQEGIWYAGEEGPLNPARGNQFVDFLMLGQYTQFTLQLSAISGGGTAEIRVMGVY